MIRSTGFAVLIAVSFALSAAAGADRPGFFRWPAFPVKSPFQLRSQSPEPGEADDEPRAETKLETPLIGDYITISGLKLMTLQGVGLVVGLNGTGGDPAPSGNRTALLEEMRRRDVKGANAILRRSDTALVIVRGYLDPLVKSGDTFDVEVRLPEDSNATSLAGGYLLETLLSEHAQVPGQGIKKGFVFAKAKGPILVGTGEGDKNDQAGVLRRGRAVGGGVSVKNRDLTVYLLNDKRSFRNAKRIADAIGERFYAYDRYGIRRPLAEAKTDQMLVLEILPRYKDNFPRYLQVVRHIAFRENEVARRVRMQRLKEDLQDPSKAKRAALELEAIGPDAIQFLKTGLSSRSLEARFHAAEALAYLGVPDGLPVLAEAAKEEPAFRVFALAAMTAADDAHGNLLLRNLMNERSAELRYGAFRALTTMDPDDPFVRGEDMNEEFMLHVLHTEGEPMVHLTNRKKAEVVLLGAEQRLRAPAALSAGNDILISAQPRSDLVTISKYAVGRPDQKRVVSTRLADVIRAASELGASFPDVAQFLIQANRQHNLEGRLEIDALPEPGRVYQRRPSIAGRKRRRTKTDEPPVNVDIEAAVDRVLQDSTAADGASEEDKGTSSVADISTEGEAASSKGSLASRLGLQNLFRRRQ